MVLRVKPTPTRFPINSLYTPIDNTLLHSISSVCHPWGAAVTSRVEILGLGVVMRSQKGRITYLLFSRQIARNVVSFCTYREA